MAKFLNEAVQKDCRYVEAPWISRNRPTKCKGGRRDYRSMHNTTHGGIPYRVLM